MTQTTGEVSQSNENPFSEKEVKNMSYFNPTTKINVDRQESFEYAIYMIFGSFFGKTVCLSPYRESTMRINYTETPAALQYEMEEICEKEAERLLRGRVNTLAKEAAEVSFIQTSGKFTEIRFTSKSFIIRLIGRYRKEGSEIRAELWSKGSLSSFGGRGVECLKGQRVA